MFVKQKSTLKFSQIEAKVPAALTKHGTVIWPTYRLSPGKPPLYAIRKFLDVRCGASCQQFTQNTGGLVT
jgi:hypothetical protein